MYRLPVLVQFLSEGFMLPCLNKQIFGFDCPGCGFQRSVALLVKGEFLEAFFMYPPIYAIIVLFGFLIADKIWKIPFSSLLTVILSAVTVSLILTNFLLKFL